MNSDATAQLAKAEEALSKASALSVAGKHRVALSLAHKASEMIAAAYLQDIKGQKLPANDEAYDLFAKIIREPARHPDAIQKIREIVGDVCVLRETYEPTLLDQTKQKDAELMIGQVSALKSLIQELYK